MRVCEGGNVYICGVWGWIWVGICVHLCVCAVFEITFGHRTFSDHFCECPDVINFVLTLQPKLPAGMGAWPKLADRSVWAHGNMRKGGKKKQKRPTLTAPERKT